jgi:hypothetical protein
MKSICGRGSLGGFWYGEEVCGEFWIMGWGEDERITSSLNTSKRAADFIARVCIIISLTDKKISRVA